MRNLLLIALTLLPAAARAQAPLDAIAGAWAIGAVSACSGAAYDATVRAADSPPSLTFRDRAGRANVEQVIAQRPGGFTTATLASPDVAPGTRWDYAAAGPDRFEVRNLATGRRFVLLRCTGPQATPHTTPRAAALPIPLFANPAELISWLLLHSGRGFDPGNVPATAPVFSPGLRAALESSYARSRRDDEPPCGAEGDILLSTQEDGAAQNIRLAVQATAPDRATVSASFDADGYHRDRRYMTVLLDGVWKLENILETDGGSLRRALDCRR